MRAYVRVYSREPGEISKYVGLMRYLFFEAVRRFLQSHVLTHERPVWVKVLSQFRTIEQQQMKRDELRADHLWQYFEIEAMEKLIEKMEEITPSFEFGTTRRDNFAAHELEHLPWVRRELQILSKAEDVDHNELLSPEELEMMSKRMRLWIGEPATPERG